MRVWEVRRRASKSMLKLASRTRCRYRARRPAVLPYCPMGPEAPTSGSAAGALPLPPGSAGAGPPYSRFRRITTARLTAAARMAIVGAAAASSRRRTGTWIALATAW